MYCVLDCIARVYRFCSYLRVEYGAIQVHKPTDDEQRKQQPSDNGRKSRVSMRDTLIPFRCERLLGLCDQISTRSRTMLFLEQ